MKSKFKQFSYVFGIVISATVLGTLLQFAKAWTEPTSAPPTVNIGAPINTSGNLQSKSGQLNIGGILSSNTMVGVGPGTYDAASRLNVNGNAKVTGDINTNKLNATSDVCIVDGKCLSASITSPPALTCSCGTCWVLKIGPHDQRNLCTPAGWVVVAPDTFSGH